MGIVRKIDRLGPQLSQEADDDQHTTAIVRRPVVLIVDDDAVVRAALTRAVALCSMRSLEAESAQEALSILERRRVDVVLCDQSMPMMTGATLLAIASARFPHVGRVLLSGHSRADLVCSEVDLASVDVFLHKGTPFPEFQATLWTLLRSRGRVD